MSQAWVGLPVSLGSGCINVIGVVEKAVCDIMVFAEFVSSGECPSGKQLVVWNVLALRVLTALVAKS